MGEFIREITEDDVPILRDLANKCKPLDLHTPFTYWVISKYFGNISYILVNNNENVGFITAIYNDQSLFIWQIGIINAYRKKGLSALLIDQVIESAKLMDYTSVQFSIASNNKDSYSAFSNYSMHHGYAMTMISELSVLDSIIPDFQENEDLFEIKLN